MPWLSIFGTLLKLAASLANYLRERQMLDAGAKAQIGRDLAALAERVGVADQVRAELAKISDADLDQELRG